VQPDLESGELGSLLLGEGGTLLGVTDEGDIDCHAALAMTMNYEILGGLPGLCFNAIVGLKTVVNLKVYL
jgi:hypothetical protein